MPKLFIRSLAVMSSMVVVGGAVASESSYPLAVSPGDEHNVVEIDAACATFSWAGVAEAKAYELVVYDLAQPEGSRPVLERKIAGGATAWTPDRSSCLKVGAQYAWTIRALGEEGGGVWSPPRFFSLPSAPSADELARAFETVRRYLGEQGLERPLVAGKETIPADFLERQTSDTKRDAGVTLTSATAALNAKQSDTTGDTAGLIGTASSPDGVGVLAANLDPGGGADLILDGSAQSLGDTAITESEIVVGGGVFDISNAGGTLDLKLDGVSVVTTATDQDTTYSAGTGLDLSTTTFSANTNYLQRRVDPGCAAGSSIRSIDATGAVTCEDDGDTTYTAGSGLNLASFTFSADTGFLQRRVGTSCAAGSSIRAIDGVGAVTCETDNNSTYSAGTGLQLSSGTFSANTTYLQRRVSSNCTAGSSIRSISSTGAVTCETDTDTDTTYSAANGLQLVGTTFSIDTGVTQARVSGNCAAGSSIRSISAIGTVTCEADTDTNTTYFAGNGLGLVGTTFMTDSTVARKNSASGNQAFDTNTLYLDYSNNFVGVRISVPDEELDVSGDVEATGQYYFSGARTFYRYVTPASFAPSPTAIPYYLSILGGYMWPQGTSPFTMAAPVVLPNTANITQVRCYYYDNDATSGDSFEDIDFGLKARSVSSSSTDDLALLYGTPLTSASSTIRSITDTTVSGIGDPVVNSSYDYFLHVTLDLPTGATASTNLRFYGCRVSFQLDRASTF